MTKTCSKCQVEKPLGEFNKDKATRDGYYSSCRDCHRKTQKKTYIKNKNRTDHETPKQKKCSSCKQILLADKFAGDKCRKDGLATFCKSCMNKISKSIPKNIRKARQKQSRKRQPAGVYSITNKKTGDVYYGASVMLKKRFREHKNHLKKNIHANKLLQKDYNIYGIDAFDFSVVVEFEPDVKKEIVFAEERKIIWEGIQKGEKLYNSIIKNPRDL